MLSIFREQKRALLKMEWERSGAKCARTDTILQALPRIFPETFKNLKSICSILKIFDDETKTVK